MVDIFYCPFTYIVFNQLQTIFSLFTYFIREFMINLIEKDFIFWVLAMGCSIGLQGFFLVVVQHRFIVQSIHCKAWGKGLKVGGLCEHGEWRSFLGGWTQTRSIWGTDERQHASQGSQTSFKLFKCHDLACHTGLCWSFGPSFLYVMYCKQPRIF